MKRQKQKINYPTEIDAAYYALHRYISPYDYVVRYIGEDLKPVTATVNPNCIIVGRLSKLNFFRPIPVGKGHFQSHFKRDEILFYKSNPDSPYFTGFGRYDKEALKLPFAKDLHITTHKKIDKNYNILLVGIDIDCHTGEKHVGEVETLIRHYLPDTYWEPSTGGKGRHGYLKLKYKNSYGVIATISSALKKLFAELNTLKNLYGYQAKIDDPAGLPFKLECVTENPYETNWKTLHDQRQSFLPLTTIRISR